MTDLFEPEVRVCHLCKQRGRHLPRCPENPKYELYGGTPPHSDSETSLAAAHKIKTSAESLRGRVLQYIRDEAARGATDDELEVALDMRHQTASARRRELVLQGAIIDSGRRRKTRSGRFAKVWVELG